MVEVRYKCYCMSDERIIFVRDRGRDEDIVDWAKFVVQIGISKDHNKAGSKSCDSQTMEYAKIHYSEQSPLGMKPVIH